MPELAATALAAAFWIAIAGLAATLLIAAGRIHRHIIGWFVFRRPASRAFLRARCSPDPTQEDGL